MATNAKLKTALCIAVSEDIVIQAANVPAESCKHFENELIDSD